MRRVILTAVVALLVVSSGCVGLITGETVEFEANEGTVSDSSLESTGYEMNDSAERTITRDVSFAGQERTIRIVNRVNRYTSSGSLVDIADNETLTENETLTDDERLNNETLTDDERLNNETLATNETLRDAVENETDGDAQVADLKQFIVVSSPAAKVLGQTLNPAAGWSNERILEQVADQTGKLNDIESDGSRTVESLGEDREVNEFTATTEVKGREVDVRTHVVSFEHEGDVVIAVGVHPDALDEEDNVDELVSGLEHSGD